MNFETSKFEVRFFHECCHQCDQDLTLTITTERSESELDLAEDLVEISSINVQSFVDEQEWELHSHVETWNPSSLPSKVYQTSKHKHPSFSASCRASRRPGFFIWNIFLVMVSNTKNAPVRQVNLKLRARRQALAQTGLQIAIHIIYRTTFSTRIDN